MSNRRFHLLGLIAVLLALMAQLGAGAAVPRLDPVAVVGLLCHAGDDAGGAPSNAPAHPADCPLCPLCVTLHGSGAVLAPDALVLPRPVALAVGRAELPPPSTGPPTQYRAPSQPRAPPTYS